MKIFSFIQITLIAGMLFIGCTKTDKPKPVPNPPPTIPSPPPPPPPPVITPGPGDTYIMVLENHTNLPVPYAFYSRSFCSGLDETGCVGERFAGSWSADSNGIIYIKGPDSLAAANNGESELNLFSKDKYWVRNGFDTLYTKDSIKRAVTRLFPGAWLKIHLKNAFYRNNNAQTIMYFDVSYGDLYLVGPVVTQPFLQYHRLFLPTNTLDTTIIIKTFAYAVNELEVEHDTTDILLNHYYYSVYHETRTVNKFDTLDWEVIVK